MDYFEFRRQFDAEHDKLLIPGDCQEMAEPDFKIATQYSWHLKWYLRFTDGKFVRIWEHHNKIAGLQDARRLSLAYHYGSIDGLDKNGLPAYGSEKPVDIRLDNSALRIHLHLGGPGHIYQESVERLDLMSLDMFTFVRGIFKHRTTKRGFDQVFGFKVV